MLCDKCLQSILKALLVLYISDQGLLFAHWTTVTFAGYYPVLNADVTVSVVTPDANVVTQSVFDNGAGMVSFIHIQGVYSFFGVFIFKCLCNWKQCVSWFIVSQMLVLCGLKFQPETVGNSLW